MQNQTSPLILTFGATDPVGAVGIQADLASFAAMGCHGLSVVTAILVGDTTQIEDIQSVDADWVADQARAVLEDMSVAAFKIGAVGSVENVAAIAEIVSDYPDVPLVLDPFISTLPDDSSVDTEDMLLVVRELLLPQSTLLVVSAVELSRLAETWREPSSEDMLLLDALRAIELGCQYVFVTNINNGAQMVTNCLFNESGLMRNDAWQRLPGSFSGAGSTLSATIAAMMANGVEAPEAVFEAQEFTLASLANAHRAGMGKLIPDRYFWAREPETPQDPS